LPSNLLTALSPRLNSLIYDRFAELVSVTRSRRETPSKLRIATRQQGAAPIQSEGPGQARSDPTCGLGPRFSGRPSTRPIRGLPGGLFVGIPEPWAGPSHRLVRPCRWRQIRL